jgi:ABC-type dipeptide/oligopeptide/nickel transport systems, permease components
MKRLKLIAKRLAQLVPILILVSVLAFTLSNVSAGDVATITLQSRGLEPNKQNITAIREELGLNAPLPVQYLNWLQKAVKFDFGVSFQTKKPVSYEILSRFPATLALALAATIISLLFSIPLALFAARRKDSAADHAIRLGSSIGATLPDFWIGLMLLYFFGVFLKIAPVISGSKLRNIFLPAFTLSLPYGASYVRVLRSNLIEVKRYNYMKAARARGLSESRALSKHGLKNALLPVVTLIGINFGKLLSGQIACETIFSWNGIGKFAIDSMRLKDLPVIQGYIMIVSITYILINLILDIVYMYIDPRIQCD